MSHIGHGNGGHGNAVTIPDAHLLFSGDFHKSGNDLIISDALHRVVVPDYFRGEKHPTLVSPEGAPLDPKVVDALTGHTAYAQAGGATAAKMIGHVAKLTGSASVVRNGVTVELQNGDAVYQTDVVQTGSASTLGLVLIDGTTFNLSANARLMLNDLTYDATSTSNTSLFTLVQGAATFVAGQVAKTGDMKVGTPVATMGIRGTAVNLDISAVDGKVSISVIDQRDGIVHAVQVFNARGDLIGTVTSNGNMLTLTPTATFDVIAQESGKTPAQIAQEFAIFQAVLNTYDLQKAIDPSLPQHTDNNSNPQTRFASVGSTPANPVQTEYHGSGGSNLPITSTTNGNTTTFTVDPTSSSGGGGTSNQQVTPPQQQANAGPTSTPTPVVPPSVSPITSGPANHSNPVMSASGDVVYDPDGVIYYYDRETGTTTQVTPNGDGITYGGQTISSDGRFVAYQGTDGTHTYVYVWGTDPSDVAHYHVQTKLVEGSSPAISGDGHTILVEKPNGSIGIYDLNGNSKGAITPTSIGTSGELSKPSISADGHLIAFWSTDGSGGAGHLYTYNVSTGAVTEIASTTSGAGTLAASISADGRYVVYQSTGETGHIEISLYDVSTGHVMFTTAGANEILAGDSKNPVISPDGHYIIFTSTAELVVGDTNAFADTYVVDVTDPSSPIYTLISEGGNAPSDAGVAISAGGLFVAFGSAASFSTGSTGNNIFVSDPTSGRSAFIQETLNSPDQLTAGGTIQLAAATNDVTITVVDANNQPTSRVTATLSGDGKSVIWNFSEAKSDFAALNYGDDLTQQFKIVLTNSAGQTTIPVLVTVHDAVQPGITPADVAPVANPVTLADAQGDGSYVIDPAVLLAAVGDIDGPSLSITDITIKSGGGTIVQNENGTWTYTPAAGFHGEVVFNYTASDGTLTSTSTANLSVVNDPATIDGTATGNVVEDTSTTASGALAVHDIDSGEAVFQPVASAALQGTYGNFTFNSETGAWTYTLDHAKANGLADGQVKHETLTVTSADGTASQVIDVTVAGANDAPVVAEGTVASGSISVSVSSSTGHSTISPALAAELAQSGLISDLPNASGFGTLALGAGDDNSSGAINITSVFGANGVNFFGQNYTSLYINNNGNITFNAPTGQYTPSAINAGLNNPIIAAFWADVDTRGHGHVYYDLDAADGVMTITWDDVGYYSYGTNKLNSFQLVLINEGNGNFDIEYRFGDIEWTTGSASGGSNGLGGTPARVGYSAGDGVHYFELPQSGNQSALLNLAATNGNTGIAGVDYFEVRNGEVAPATMTTTGTIDFTDPDLSDTHTVQSVTYTGSGSALGTLTLVKVTDTTGSGTGGEFKWTYTANPTAVRNALDGTDTHSKVETFDVVISDGHGGTLTQTVSINLTESGSVNHAPVVSGPVGGTATEDGTPSALNALANASDADNNTLTVVNLPDELPAGVTFNANTHTFTLDPSAAAYQHLAAGATTTVTVNYGVSDGQSTTSASASWTVTGTNDPATIDGTMSGALVEDATTTVNSGQVIALDTTSGTLTVHDVDDGDSHFQPVDPDALTGNYGTFTFEPDTGQWTYQLDHAKAQALGGDEVVHDTLTVMSADGTASQQIDVSITGTNDAPTLVAKDLAPTYQADGSAVALVSNVAVSDVDTANFSGGTLTATVTAGGHEGDTLTIDESQYIHVVGNAVQFDADGDGNSADFVTIGTLSDDINSLSVDLNANATDAAVAALTNAIEFLNTKPDPEAGTRTVTFTLNDGGGTDHGGHDSASFEATVDVQSIADDQAPTVAGDMSVVTVADGDKVALTTADLNAIDPDSSPNDLIFTVVDLEHGRLSYGDGGEMLEVGDTFTLADIQAGRVFYNSVGSYTGQDHLTLSLTDNVAGTPAQIVKLGATIVDAQYTVLTPDGVNFESSGQLEAMGSGEIGDTSFAGFTITNHDANLDFTVTGTGLTYDGSMVTGGMITGILVTTDDLDHTPVATFELHVDAADWMSGVTARAGGDPAPLEALVHHWTFNFVGGAGMDAFDTGDQNDYFTGRGGNDELDGGFGYDRTNYGGATGPIHVLLADGTVVGDGSVGTDTLRSIELVTGSNYDDYFNAGPTDSNPNGFSASSTNAGSTDSSNLGGFFNEFEGRGGNDTIVGNGQTRVSYYHATSGVTVTFEANSWTSAASGGSGTVTGDASVGQDTFSGVSQVRGSYFDDVFNGSNNPAGVAENFEGLGGNDDINGGGGFDRAIYSRAADDTGIDVQLAAGIVTGGIDTGTDTLRSVEAIWGTDFDDTYDARGFTASGDNSSVNSGSGDTGVSSSFNEFEGGAGDDTVYGNGNTRVAFTHATGGVVVTLGAEGSGTADGNDSVGHDTFISGVTRVRGSEFNDIISGNSLNNVLQGQGGNDVLDGKGGNDFLTGGTGADIFVYGQGYGITQISDFSHREGDRIDLRAFSNVHSVQDLTMSIFGSTLVITSPANFGDASHEIIVQGVDPANPLTASDFIFNAQVAVTVQTPDGYDFSTLYDDLANGVVDHKFSTSDHVFVENAAKGITFEMIGTGFTYNPDNGTFTDGTITEIDIVTGTDFPDKALATQDHVLVNSNGWNIDAGALFSAIERYASSESEQHASGLSALNNIFGSASYSYVGSAGAEGGNGEPHSGADVFVGGSHPDIFNGLGGPFGWTDVGNDTVDYSLKSDGVTVNLFTGETGGGALGDTFISIENLRGTAYDDVLTGNDYNNVLEGGLGHNTLDGGRGYNVASYEHATAGVTVDLNLQGEPQDTGGAGIDTLTNIQGLFGSGHNDTLYGNGSSVLEGGDGDDHLIGLADGHDTASYEHATAGVNVNLNLQGGDGQNTHGAGFDTLINIANVSGSHFADVLIGDANDNVFFGNGGNDTFVFSANNGHDTIGDFFTGQDKLDLGYSVPTDAASFDRWLNSVATMVGNDTLIDLDPVGSNSHANTILLKNVYMGNLQASDFVVHGSLTN